MNNSLFTVIAFTVKNKFRSKAFFVTSLIIAIILSIVINLPYMISIFSSKSPTKVGVLNTEPEITGKLTDYFDKQKDPELKIVLLDDAGSDEANDEMIKQNIADGKIKGFLSFEEDSDAGFPKVAYKSESSMAHEVSTELQTALQQIKTEMVVKDVGLSQDQLEKLFSPIQIETVQISAEKGAGTVGDGKTESQVVMSYVMVYALIILLMMGTMVSGQLIATEITAEKSSRVMEILITSVSPLQQMFGKIIGMFIVMLSQIAVFVIVAIINITLPHNVKEIKKMNLSLSDIEPTMIFYAILFYLMGFFLFSSLFAAVGSIVSRTEDLGQAIMPITFIAMAGFYIGIFGINAPNSTIVVASSFIPVFTPFIMFLRVGMSDPAVWEVWLSIGVLLVTILVMGWLSAKIYRTGVLMYGKRPSIKELRKAMKAYKV